MLCVPKQTLQSDIDFLLIQENPSFFIRNIPSVTSERGDPLIGPVHHRQWQCVEKTASQPSSQVAIYINRRFLTDYQIFPDLSPTNDPNVLPVTLQHNIIRSRHFTLINVYNPPKTNNAAIHSLLTALPRFNNAVVIEGDFNLHSGIWDPARVNSPPLSTEFFNRLSDASFGLVNDEGAPTWTNRRGSTSVIDLVFISDALAPLSPDLFINMEGRGRSDHTLISLVFGSTDHWGRPYIPTGEEEEEQFILDLASSIRSRSTTLNVEDATRLVADDILASWNRNAKAPRVGGKSISWWTTECQRAKDTYLASRTRENQRLYDAATKSARMDFFNRKIDQMSSNDSPWEGVHWTKPRAPPKFSTILRDNHPIPDVETLFDTMHAHFSTSAAAEHISWMAIDQILQHPERSFPLILLKELWDALRPTTNSSAPGPDHVTWRHLKHALSIPDTDAVLVRLFNNICHEGTWPSHFKDSYSVIIPKPNKPDYTIPKAYRPIALLNTIGKLLTKILANRLQHDATEFGLLHRDQFGGIQKHSMIDAGLVLTDFISEHRERGWHTSVCAIDVAQFFPSLSHAVMTRILERLGFSQTIVALIKSYFTGRVTSYRWDSAVSHKYDFNLGTPQGNCLSPILSALYISTAIRKVFPETMPPASTRCLFFVDDGSLITASPSLQTNVDVLRLYLLLLLQALSDLGLQVEASKTELIHFFAFELTASRRLAISQQPHLSFTWRMKDFDIPPAARWCYLGFFFTPTMDFSFHVQYYTNKAFSTIRACNMLGSSVRGISPRQRSHAYQACALSVLTYGLPLWYAMWGRGVIKLVKKMERVHSYALGWITGSFRTSPIGTRELVAGIPPLKIILNMRLQGTIARLASLGENHTLSWSQTLKWLPTAIVKTPPRQRARHLPSDNPLTRLSTSAVREQFMPFHPISRPSNRVSDIFSHRIFFELTTPKRSSKYFATWMALFGPKQREPHMHTLLITTTHGTTTPSGAPAGSSHDSELAALEDAIQWSITNRIEDPVFFVDNKAVLTSFLNTNTHSSQMSSIRINVLLHDHLSTTANTFSFAYCPSHVGIEGNEHADKLTKTGAAMGPATPARILRSNLVNDFRQDMTRHWRILSTSHTYKGSGWLPIQRKKRLFKPAIGNKQTKTFFLAMAGNDILTTSRMARAITGHAPMGEYRQRFFPNLSTHCDHCGPSIPHTRSHILFDCPKYVSLATSLTDWTKNKYNDKSWKSFFQANPSAFTFSDLLDDVH
ncbi:hypothetical protein AX14_005794 [Amanita brunnescens Koide BX004]|nr:hypothetical protein AX14_005794 [Amanita brunnescens Koide BX004]